MDILFFLVGQLANRLDFSEDCSQILILICGRNPN